MKPVDINNKTIRKLLGNYIVNSALCMHINLYEDDLKYISNVMWRDTSARILLHGARYSDLISNPNYKDFVLSEPAALNKWCKMVVVLEKYYNDSACPRGVRSILGQNIDLYKHWIIHSRTNLKILNMRRPYLEHWLEMCR